MKLYGDIYVVKDSATACFVEFHYLIEGDQDFVNQDTLATPANEVEAMQAEQSESNLRRLKEIIEHIESTKNETFPELEIVCTYKECLPLREKILSEEL